MAERSIVCRADEVRRLLANEAVEIRRTMKPQPGVYLVGFGAYEEKRILWPGKHPPVTQTSDKAIWVNENPFGLPGETRWVRETWALEDLGEDGERVVWKVDRAAAWRAPGEKPFYLDSDYEPKRWRSATQMPRWASRLEVTISAVRCERSADRKTWEWVITAKKAEATPCSA